MKIYPLSLDVVFKLFFKKNKKFVSIILKNTIQKDVKPEEIKDATTVHEPFDVGGKTIINDLVFELPDLTIIFMEMQNLYNKYFRNRMEYYMCKLIAQLLNEGYSYDKLKPLYGIFFINTKEDFPKLFTRVTTFDNIESGKENIFNMIVINLAYLDENVCNKDFFSILKYMKTKNEEEMVDMKDNGGISKEIYEELEKIAGDPAYREILNVLEKEEHDKNTNILVATEQGIEFNQKETIINMYQNNLSIDVIKKCTKLEENKILDILKSNGLMK